MAFSILSNFFFFQMAYVDAFYFKPNFSNLFAGATVTYSKTGVLLIFV